MMTSHADYQHIENVVVIHSGDFDRFLLSLLATANRLSAIARGFTTSRADFITPDYAHIICALLLRQTQCSTVT